MTRGVKNAERDTTLFLRVPKSIWKYLRLSAAHDETSVNDIVNDILISYKHVPKKREKTLD